MDDEFVDGPGGIEHVARRVTGAASTKSYRCPGCDQEIRPGTPHVVAWPTADLANRRHWHAACWDRRDVRRPGVIRSRNAPRH